LAVLLVVLAFLSFGLEPVKIEFGQIIALVGSRLGWSAGAVDYAPFTEETLWSILWAVRLPRVLPAILVGAALAVAGAGMQGLFRNPLADPSLIGVSAGAAMGAPEDVLRPEIIENMFQVSAKIIRDKDSSTFYIVTSPVKKPGNFEREF